LKLFLFYDPQYIYILLIFDKLGNGKQDVLAQVHGDPLFRNRESKKLECFSKKRFGELKKAVRVLGRRKIIK